MKLLNWSESIARLQDDKELYLEVCEIFVDEIPKLVESLGHSVVEKSKPEDIASLFHSIRGAAANIGAEKLADISAGLEIKIRNLANIDWEEGLELQEFEKVKDDTLREVHEYLESCR